MDRLSFRNLDNHVQAKPVTLKKSEVSFSQLSLADSCGHVFHYDSRIFRAIHPNAVDEVTELFKSGLIDELVTEGLFPRTWVSDIELEGYGLILEHEKVDVITYPFEWSFSMLKAAALTVLRVNETAGRFGYELKDCHCYNVTFSGAQPKYLDLGSFVKSYEVGCSWRAYEEFIQSYVYPLKLWSQGNYYFARRVIGDQSLLPHESYYLYKFPLLRSLRRYLGSINKLFYVYYKSRLLSSYPPEFIRRHMPTQMTSFLDFALKLKKRGWLPFQSTNLSSLRARVEKIRQAKYSTAWSNYHDEHIGKDLHIAPTPRFTRLLELVRTLPIMTVVELGGNQGVFSNLLLQQTQVKRVVCTDADEAAIERLYARLTIRNQPLQAAVVDLMVPMVPAGTIEPARRFQSDAVMALALIHHLLLKPPFFQVDNILDHIGRNSSRYVFVEYMPMGLFDGTSGPPVPDWYTLDWFRSAFARHFKVLHEEQLEPNRVVFVGEKLSNAGTT